MKRARWQAAAAEHARRAFPREACGLLVDGRFLPCRNTARGTDHFAMDARDYARCEELGRIEAVFHSHPNASANPSAADRVACEQTGLPWHILGLPSGVWTYCAPCGYEAPLIGRPFYHGVLDCYSLIRDWYARERGIALRDFAREDEWWHHGRNLYVEHFRDAGFVPITLRDLQCGDVILMQICANTTNHGAIYLGDGVILQHLHGRLSGREVYGGYWRKHSTHWLRYVGEAAALAEVPDVRAA